MRWGLEVGRLFFKSIFLSEQNLYKKLQDISLYFVTLCSFFEFLLLSLSSYLHLRQSCSLGFNRVQTSITRREEARV